ncbi:ABC transporter A family member 7 [Artemisia annua]|uniref:ABC transporter A family member 7 n=1 Tax=Artemisia annua TaxID=35608 RepID=A0A2U1M3B4_ARTAN|nr:ABC transporter A family member 7 [Artemisia annua]
MDSLTVNFQSEREGRAITTRTKVYPGRDGNPEKFAVRGLSLALSKGECFGMLGPNGAGKSSFIHMMIGLIKPSSGTAYVRGLDIRDDMDEIYANMGVCPQHDLLWETLTGREHLLFYGRLKNLRGFALIQAVEESLRSVNLLNGGVGDKQVGKYSGGMKRRLSVAISLIGDPTVVYMDEPSTGLDPTSRNNLWNVIKQAKENRAIFLTISRIRMLISFNNQSLPDQNAHLLLLKDNQSLPDQNFHLLLLKDNQSLLDQNAHLLLLKDNQSPGSVTSSPSSKEKSKSPGSVTESPSSKGISKSSSFDQEKDS